jgi:hypothetical protein
MKNLKYLCLFILIVGVIFGGYKVFTFSLFESELTLIEKLPVDQSDYSVLIYSFPSSATIQGAIQIHLIQDKTGKTKLFKDYEIYNKVLFAKIMKVRHLEIALKDSLKTSTKADTVYVDLPKSYKN